VSKKKKKKAAKNEAPEAAPEPDAYTITEFCARHRISRTTYYRLREKQRAPVEVPIGSRRVIITREAAARWRAQQDADAAKAAKA
jgi:hypothetical protein